jgi:hypothetical protein
MASPAQQIPPECPWHGAQQLFGEPNVKWCEERLCQWANEPANTWSNLGYLAVGLWMLLRARQSGSATERRFGGAILMMGLFSLAYHATNNFGTQLLDFVGMFLFVFLMLATNLWRGRWIPASRVIPVYAGLNAAGTAAVLAMYAAGLPFQALVALAAVAIIGTEAVIARRGPDRPATYRHFALGFVLIVVAAAFSASDVSRAWCDPTNHWIQGHAIWHWIGAAAVGFMARHYTALGLDEHT